MELSELNKQIITCKKCRLWKTAAQAVPGEGPADAAVILVGQNPGAEEDKTGKPFVGRAGKFLNKTLKAKNISRDSLFITNLVKHTSPQNRKPLPDEIEACSPYLAQQMSIIKPKIVVLMGAVAWQSPRMEGIRYIETVHPSAAMRFTKMRKRFDDDFKTIGNFINNLQ